MSLFLVIVDGINLFVDFGLELCMSCVVELFNQLKVVVGQLLHETFVGFNLCDELPQDLKAFLQLDPLVSD